MVARGFRHFWRSALLPSIGARQHWAFWRLLDVVLQKPFVVNIQCDGPQSA
jgi:hypothetical protein